MQPILEEPLMTDISPKVERRVALVDENETVLDAAAVMVGRHIGSVVVTGSATVKGIFTERDLMRVVAQQQDPSQIQLKQVMRTDLAHVTLHESVENCMSLMQINRCRHLLVFEDDAFVGIVSLRDLAALMLDEKEALVGELTKYITS
jgi:CBS domain-containing protein